MPNDPPPGCDSFPIWKRAGRNRYMRCACGNTATAVTDEQERLARKYHYDAVRRAEVPANAASRVES